MRYSDIFSKTQKISKQFDSLGTTLLIRGGYIRQTMAGVYNFLFLGLRVLRKVEQVIREEMENIGAQEILMSVLQNEDNWRKTGRWDSMNEILFKLKLANKKNLTLGPTHEELVTPIVKEFGLSYKDLPIAVFQIQNKFRNEARAKSGLLRGREFFMKDLYSFHADEEDLNDYYEKVVVAYNKIWERLGIGDITYKTYATGGDFSKYSHEFQTLSEIGEDTIYVCERCKVAVNKEIIKEQSSCPECGNENLVEKTAVESGNIFKLGTKFSEAFDYAYTASDNSLKDVVMGCYGIGTSRLVGVLAEIFNDGQKFVWPDSVAPFDIHLIGLNLKDTSVKKKAELQYEKLLDKGLDVLFDDREGVAAGEKFADADLIGIRQRFIISKRTGNKIEKPIR